MTNDSLYPSEERELALLREIAERARLFPGQCRPLNADQQKRHDELTARARAPIDAALRAINAPPPSDDDPWYNGYWC